MKIFPIINSCDGKFSGSMDIRFTKICDNACSFCIERPGLEGMKTDVDAMIQSTIASGKKSVLILGGEPLLMIDKVLTYVKGIRNHVDEIFITTSLPRTISKKMDVFLEIADLVDGINVSLQHYDWKRNNEILVARNKFNRIAMLTQMLTHEQVARKVRVSINLVKGGIDNRAELMTFLGVLLSIGCQHVKINELQHSPETYVSYESIMGEKMKSPYAHGCQFDVPLFENMRVTLKRSCFLVEPSLEATVMDMAKIMKRRYIDKPHSNGNAVMYEDGRVMSGWVTSDGDPAPSDQ